MNLGSITPVILTFNEENNIRRTLDCLRVFKRVIVIDSISDDSTLNIVSEYPNALVFRRAFDSHSSQWNYGLEQVETPWVLSLDADYQITEEFINEIKRIQTQDSCVGYKQRFKYVLDQKVLVGCLYPPRVCLFRKNSATFYQDGHTQRLKAQGRILDMKSPILHDDHKSLRRWLDNQIRYSEHEVFCLLKKKSNQLRPIDRLRKTFFLMPVLTVPYCLFVKGVILNGVAGWRYVLERTLAEIIISLMLIERYRKSHENNRN